MAARRPHPGVAAGAEPRATSDWPRCVLDAESLARLGAASTDCWRAAGRLAERQQVLLVDESAFFVFHEWEDRVFARDGRARR